MGINTLFSSLCNSAKTTPSSEYIFAGNENFFAYRNNYNHYVSYYKNTYQHGGISMEEMIIPFVHFSTKI